MVVFLRRTLLWNTDKNRFLVIIHRVEYLAGSLAMEVEKSSVETGSQLAG